MSALKEIFNARVESGGTLVDAVRSDAPTQFAQPSEAQLRKAASGYSIASQSPKEVTFKTSLGEVSIPRKNLKLTDGHFAEAVYTALAEKQALEELAEAPFVVDEETAEAVAESEANEPAEELEVEPELQPDSAQELIDRVREMRRQGVESLLATGLDESPERNRLLIRIATAHSQPEIDQAIAEGETLAAPHREAENWLKGALGTHGLTENELMSEYQSAVRNGQIPSDFDRMQAAVKRLRENGKLHVADGRLVAKVS